MVKLKISGLFMGEGNSYPLSEIIKTDKYLPFTIYHLVSDPRSSARIYLCDKSALVPSCF